MLEDALQCPEEKEFKSRRLSLTRVVESSAAHLLAKRYPDRQFKPNVEFYTAILLDVIGIPPELFSHTHAVGRVAGWCAHLAEQQKCGRLIRPQSKYVGAEHQSYPWFESFCDRLGKRHIANGLRKEARVKYL